MSQSHPQLYGRSYGFSSLSVLIPRGKKALIEHSDLLFPVDILRPSLLTQPIPKCQLPVPRNMFCVVPPVATSVKIPYQKTHSHDCLLRIRKGKRNQGAKNTHPPKKTRHQHLDLQSSQAQMPRGQCKNTINNMQDKISPLDPSNPATVGCENSSTAKVQEKDLKIAFMKTIEGYLGKR